MKLYNVLFCLAAGLITVISLLAMDDAQPDAPLKLMNVPEIFKLTDQQINQTRFYQAICEGDIKLVRGMIKNKKINPNKVLTAHSLFIFGLGQNGNPGQIGYLPITYSAVYADPNKFKKLQRHTEQFLPLTLAVAENKVDIVRFLVEKCKVNINDCNKDIAHPLHTARLDDEEYIPMIQYLIDHGANPLYRDRSIHHHTVLESIDWGLACPKELGPDRIAKLQKIRPIIAQALKKRNYPNPYANSVSSSSSDSDEDTDDATDSDEADIDEDADDDGNLATKSPLPLPSSSSSSAGPNNNGNAVHHPNDSNVPPIVAHQHTPRGDDTHQDMVRPVLHTNCSWKILAAAAVGVVCGILCIKKLYAWYTSRDEKDEQEEDQNEATNVAEHM